MTKDYKEELTTKMHAEFTVSKETEIKHKAFTVLTLSGVKEVQTIKYWCEVYQIPIRTVMRFLPEFRVVSEMK